MNDARMAPASAITPMRLLRIPELFDHPEWIFEPKMDGFRALAHIEGHRCTLVSRNGYTFKSWPRLPIFDSRVRRAVKRLYGISIPVTVRGYITSYIPLFMRSPRTVAQRIVA